MFNCTIHPRVTAGLKPVYSFGIFYFGKPYILSKFSIIVFRAFPSIICLEFDPSKLKFYDRIPCSERRKWHFRGSNFKNFFSKSNNNGITYTSLLEVYFASSKDSIAIHFAGSLPFKNEQFLLLKFGFSLANFLKLRRICSIHHLCVTI